MPLTYNPVVKNGKFSVLDALTGTIKVFRAVDYAEARHKMLKHLNVERTRSHAAEYAERLNDLRVTEVEPTKRLYN